MNSLTPLPPNENLMWLQIWDSGVNRMEPEDRVTAPRSEWGHIARSELGGRRVVTDLGRRTGQVGGKADWGRRQDRWAGQIWGRGEGLGRPR